MNIIAMCLCHQRSHISGPQWRPSVVNTYSLLPYYYTLFFMANHDPNSLYIDSSYLAIYKSWHRDITLPSIVIKLPMTSFMETIFSPSPTLTCGAMRIPPPKRNLSSVLTETSSLKSKESGLSRAWLLIYTQTPLFHVPWDCRLPIKVRFVRKSEKTIKKLIFFWCVVH